MKKTLGMFALLSISTGAALAQSTVSMYGIMDLNVNVDDGSKASGRLTRMSSGQTGQSGSRIGFNGTEALGNGMSALFVLEAGILPDTGTSDQNGVLFGRAAYVGVKGDFGMLRAGRLSTPLWTAQGRIDPFGVGLAGDMSRVFGTSGKRTDNTINYTTPNVKGLSGEFAYSFGEQSGDAQKGRQIGMTLAYENGPYTLSLSREVANNIPPGTAAITRTTTTLIGASASFGPAKVHAAYDINSNGAALDTHDALLGLSLTFGAQKVFGDYIWKVDKFNTNADAKQYAIGYIYSLSQRTSLYTSYSHLTNEAKGKLQVELAGHSDTFYNVGMRHTF
jgi:predicted porin